MIGNWNYFQKLSLITKVPLFTKLPTIKLSLEVPEKIKGTVLEKWINFWKGLYNDYTEVFRDTMQEARSKPHKTAAFIAAGSFLTYAMYNNPTERDYRDSVINCENLIGLVGKPIRNPGVEIYLKSLENSFNSGVIRRFSLGICCLIWIDNYDDALGLYKVQCKYLKPKYLSYYERIIDFGFLNRFWILEKNMKDYDVNPNEWIDFSKSEYGYRNNIL